MIDLIIFHHFFKIKKRRSTNMKCKITGELFILFSVLCRSRDLLFKIREKAILFYMFLFKKFYAL